MIEINQTAIMPQRFKAVIFDFGGVITASPFDAFTRFEDERGLPRDFIRNVNAIDADSNAWARLERSEIDLVTFDRLFAQESERLGFRVSGSEVLPLIAGEVRSEMVAALDRLREAGLRLACITNNMRPGGKIGFAQPPQTLASYAAVMRRFEHVIESAEAGVRKPDPRIYAMMCERLHIPPQDCIYLDDLGINCKPAAAMGMHAIKVRSAPQALDDLQDALGGLVAL